MPNVSVLNTTAQVSGKTLAVCENDQTISGAWTFSGNQTFNGNVSLGNAASDTLTITATIISNLLFTDATYDIGASGATRPRDLFLSRTALVGTALIVGTADTSGVRLDLESGVLAVREGDDSAYASVKALTLESTTTATVGTTLTVTGGKIAFPATQSASADTNTLDDYEEDTWTPTYGGYTGSVTTTTAKYTKIGDLVCCVLAFTGTSNAGDLTFTLPFTCGRTLSTICGAAIDNGSSQNTPPRCDFAAASATVTVFKSFDGTAFTGSGTKAFSAMFFFHTT